MEIKSLLTIISILFFTSCKGTSLTVSDTTKVERLRKYYQLSIETNALENKQKFFDYFPSTFLEFNSLYGYNNGKAEILYEEAPNHIHGLLCQLKPSEIQGYYGKLIRLTYGAYWEADAVSYLQHCIQKHFQENADSFGKVLGTKSQDQIGQFFAFYFSGPHPPKQIPLEIESIRFKRPKLYSIALDVFKKTPKDEK